MAWWNKQGTTSTRIPQDQQQYFSGTDWRSQMQPMSAGWSNTNQAPVNYQDYDEQAAADLGSMGIDQDINNAPTSTGWRSDPGVDAWESEHGTLEGVGEYPGIQQPRPYQDRIMNPNLMNLNRDGIMGTDQAQENGMFSNMLSKLKNIPTPMNMMRSAVRNPLDPQSPNFNPMLEGQLDTYGNYVGETGEDPLQGQNLVSGFGTNDVTAQLRKRLQKLRMYDYKSKIKEGKESQLKKAIAAQVAAENRGYQGTPGGNVGSGVFAKMDQSGKTYGPYSGGSGNNPGMAQGSAKGSMPTGTAGRNPWGRADGGRIGYQGGELVEQETDFIEGPQGGEEFQETVVEGQDQPSREQLEALAMEISQLPLEELDEQQLLVVYQEAMQGRPMEEAVQEEDVQFAAQGGLAGLL